jgi:DICT domain-containing protein
MGIVQPLYTAAIKCRELWVRQRAMSLLRSIHFREGVWDAKLQAAIAQVAINRENSFMDPNNLEKDLSNLYGFIVWDRTSWIPSDELQKLNSLDSP